MVQFPVEADVQALMFAATRDATVLSVPDELVEAERICCPPTVIPVTTALEASSMLIVERLAGAAILG